MGANPKLKECTDSVSVGYCLRLVNRLGVGRVMTLINTYSVALQSLAT